MKLTEAPEDKKLRTFLQVVRSNGRDLPISVWGAQVRRSLSDDLVKIGWGGVFELTDAGRRALEQSQSQEGK